MISKRRFARIKRLKAEIFFCRRFILIFGTSLFGAILLMHNVEPALAQASRTLVTDGRILVLDENFTGIAKVAIEERIDIRLKALLGAGYSWSLEGLTGESAILLGSKIEDADIKQPGVGGQSNWQVFSFEAIKVGTTQVRFIYRQPWLKPADSDRRLSFTLSVQEGK
jgi:predicted secreted protein